jgi:hypothetical protein
VVFQIQPTSVQFTISELEMADNYQNQAHFNTVVVQQKEMDRVGFEPTTSAAAAAF